MKTGIVRMVWVAVGFGSFAKIKMPAKDEQGSGLAECQYTFVRSSALR